MAVSIRALRVLDPVSITSRRLSRGSSVCSSWWSESAPFSVIMLLRMQENNTISTVELRVVLSIRPTAYAPIAMANAPAACDSLRPNSISRSCRINPFAFWIIRAASHLPNVPTVNNTANAVRNSQLPDIPDKSIISPVPSRNMGTNSVFPTKSRRFIRGDDLGMYLLSTMPARKAPTIESRPIICASPQLKANRIITNRKCEKLLVIRLK